MANHPDSKYPAHYFIKIPHGGHDSFFNHLPDVDCVTNKIGVNTKLFGLTDMIPQVGLTARRSKRLWRSVLSFVHPFPPLFFPSRFICRSFVSCKSGSDTAIPWLCRRSFQCAYGLRQSGPHFPAARTATPCSLPVKGALNSVDNRYTSSDHSSGCLPTAPRVIATSVSIPWTVHSQQGNELAGAQFTTLQRKTTDAIFFRPPTLSAHPMYPASYSSFATMTWPASGLGKTNKFISSFGEI